MVPQNANFFVILVTVSDFAVSQALADVPVGPKSPQDAKIIENLSKSDPGTRILCRIFKVMRYDRYCSGPVFLVDFHIVPVIFPGSTLAR